jgi:hypothetical protein
MTNHNIENTRKIPTVRIADLGGHFPMFVKHVQKEKEIPFPILRLLSAGQSETTMVPLSRG